VDRQVDSWNRLTTEYQYSWVSPAGKHRHAGIIKHGGPSGWLVGANYLVTGAVVYFNEDRYSGGGGLNVDGAGAYYRKVFSRIGVELRLVDMNTSEICWSAMVESWVSGTEIGMDLFRFVTAWGDEYLVSAEAGRAQYLPTDHALQVCLATAVVDMIRENEAVFIARPGAEEERPGEENGDGPQKDVKGVEDAKEPSPPPEPGATEGQKGADKDQGPCKPQKGVEEKKAEQPGQEQSQKPRWLKRPGAVAGW